MLQIIDLAASEDTIRDSATGWFESIADSTDDSAENIVLILAQLDPMELVDGQPRWSGAQIMEIEKAKAFLAEWEQEDPAEARDDSAESDSDEPKSEAGDESAPESVQESVN